MQSPLLGFNNNVKHRGRVFHIQTEDSGIKHPHVITHLFADGGRILKTTKTSYAEHLSNDRLSDLVRAMMKEQHQAMAMALHKGEFDRQAFDDGSSSRAAKAAPTPTPRPPSTRPAAVEAKAPVAAVATVAKVSPSDRPSPRRFSPDKPEAGTRPGIAPLPAKGKGRPSEPSIRDSVRDKAPRVAAKVASVAPPAPSSASLRAAAASPRAPSDPSREKKTAATRFVASRPAAAFAASGPGDGGRGLFGEDVISEKSLDEVILGYLSEEDVEGATGSQK